MTMTLILLAATAVVGCRTIYRHPDWHQSKYYEDRSECVVELRTLQESGAPREAGVAVDVTVDSQRAAPLSAVVMGLTINDCLEARGWTRSRGFAFQARHGPS